MSKPRPSMQRTFDTVARHLLKQNRRAVMPATTVSGVVASVCRYRAPNGDKCAVGCLIPDELYEPQMEGVLVAQLLEEHKALHKEPLINGFGVLLVSLQSVHDIYEPRYWREQLTLVAERFYLNTEALYD